MIFSKCPRCGSNRIRRGYRPSSTILKLFGRYNLLCDDCNWEFTGFAIPGTVSAKPTRKKKKFGEKYNPEKEEFKIENKNLEENVLEKDDDKQIPQPMKKRVRVKKKV